MIPPWVFREIDPKGGITEYSYTPSEKIAAIVDAGGMRSGYGYDLKDRLVEVRRHGRVRESYVYDGADNLIEKRDTEGKPLLTFAVGPGNVLKQRRLASGDVQDFEYTKEGRLVQAANGAGTATFAYNVIGRRIADERNGKGVRHRFAVNRITQTTVLGKYTTQYIAVDATTTIVLDPGGQTQRLRVLAPGLVERSCSNETEEISHYDVSGRCLLKSTDGPSLKNGKTEGWARRFTYSGEGDLLARDDTHRGTTKYVHDEAHRLSKVSLPDGNVEDYLYDRAGNLLRAPGLEARMVAGNLIAEANGDRFRYNKRDSLDSREWPAGKTTYTYDSRDFLIGIDGPGINYQAKHDGLGRRTEKTVNGQTWQYYWDTDRLAAEVFPDGRLRVYVYPDAFALVPMLFLDYESMDADPASGKRYHMYSDHLGCPELVLDDTGRTVWKAKISPYGTAHVEVGANFHQPLRWPGHYFDKETGLQDNRFRTYSPELGRYLQSDPSGTEGGINLYAYTDNPLRAVDLRGNAQSCPDNVKDCPHRKEGGEDKEGTKPQEIPDNVWHATTSPGKAKGVLTGIDPKFLDAESRFGKAFHVSENPDTTIAELTHHQATATTGIRFAVNKGEMRTLDLTDPTTANAWGYQGGPITPVTQAIGAKAKQEGFNTIKFPSERDPGGINYAIIGNHNAILSPMMVTPTEP